jgi:hypothetical protein
MTKANRVRITAVREVTPGTTPTTPRMRRLRWTGEGLALFTPTFIKSDEIRDDRMNSDPTQIFHDVNGSINIDVSYPVDLTPESEMLQSLLLNSWTNTPSRDNDGTADSVITAVATTNEVLTCTTGAAFVAGHLAKFSGFGVVLNNGVFKCTLGSATVPRFIGAGLTDEAVPPAAARVKVVGFQGAAADITATASGLGSTLLDFTTLGLVVGQTLKIGGSAAGDRFATAALNKYVTVSAIAANALTLANLPTGWTTDAGTGKTIKVWFGDTMKNGTVQAAITLEKGFMGQAVPNYHVGTGVTINTRTETLASKSDVKAVYNIMGMGGSHSTTSLDDSPDAATTAQVFASNINVGRISEGGSPIASPNFCKSLEWTVNNNFQAIEDITIDSPAGNDDGSCDVTVKYETYYGDGSYYTKFKNGTPTAIHTALYKNNQAITRFFPRITYISGNPVASGKNTQVMLPLEGEASFDTLTNAHVIIDRLEYLEI